MCRVNDTPRQRETEGDRERESVCEYTNEEDFQFNFIQKSRHRERERFFGLVQILSRKVSRKHPSRPRAPPANAASSPNVCFRTRPRRLHRHPRPSRSARRVQKRTHQFSLQVFRPSLLKSLSPFGGTRSHFRVKRRRVKIHARPVSLERERPLLSSRAKTDDDETKEEKKKDAGSHLGGVDHHRERRRHFFANACLQCTAFLLFLLPLFEENGVLSP